MTTEEKLKEIKRSFRIYMNGEASRSMREKGASWHLNWGVSMLHLKEMAAGYQPDYHLAVALWKENIRECRILATLLMPPAEMPAEVAGMWLEQTTTLEMAEMAASNLYWRLPYAAELAFRCVASSEELLQVSGFHIFSRLFSAGTELNMADANEFMDQALSTLSSGSPVLRQAAYNSIVRFSSLGEMNAGMAENALKSVGL